MTTSEKPGDFVGPWLAIEDAPLDGTPILAAGGHPDAQVKGEV